MAEEKVSFIRWDNHVSIGHLFTTLLLIASVIIYVVRSEGRVTALERYDLVLEKRIDDARADTKEALQEIKTVLQSIDQKLDRKMDK